MLSSTARRSTRRLRTGRLRTRRLRIAGHRAARSESLRVLARAGFAARGVIYVLIGWLALQIAFGHAGRSADSRGALQTVSSTTGGEVALWLLGIGFVGLAVWRFAQGVSGTGPDGHKTSTRVLALCRAVLYGFLAYGTLRYAAGSGAPPSTNKLSADFTATLLRHPGGQALVIVVGLVLVGAGLYLIRNAWRKAFLRELATGTMSADQRKIVIWLGEFGGIARGAVFAVAGVFMIVAGAQRSPGKAKGVDSTLRTFAHTALGPWLLVLVAIGLALFGAYSFCEARWRRV